MEGMNSNTTVAAAANATPGVKGNSLPDIKGQENGIGIPPVVKDLQKSPTEKSLTEDSIFAYVNNQMQALAFDANSPAKGPIGLDGIPE
jgi:hypothetical protein